MIRQKKEVNSFYYYRIWKLVDAEQAEGPEVLKKPVDEEARVGIKGEEKGNDFKQSYL